MANGDPLLNQPDEIVIIGKPPQIDSPVSIDPPKVEQLEKSSAQPGMYEIVKCDIVSPNVAKAETGLPTPVNMIPMIDTVTVYEDIGKPYLLCDIAIRDGFGFRETIPIIGEEFINFEAYTYGFDQIESDNPRDNIIQKTFRIYSVSPIVNSSERLKLYVLHCISIEAIISEKKKISKGYANAKIEDVVKDLYENYIAKPLTTYYSSYTAGMGGPKKLVVEPTSDYHTFCFPFNAPFDIMKDLAEKATSLNEQEEEGGDMEDDVFEAPPADGALYMYYETLTHFKFESLETSFKREPKRHIVSTVSTEHDPELIKQKVHVPGQLNNAEKYQVDSLFDVVQNMREGMYSSKLITHDIIRMRYNQIGYRYIENKDQHEAEIHAAEFSETPTTVAGKTPDADTSRRRLIDLTRQLGPGKLCSYNHDCLLDDSGGEGSLVKFTATNMNHSYFLAHNRKGPGGGGREPGINENNVELRVQKRASQLQQLDNIKITVKIPGDSSLRVGDIIEWHMPSQIMNEDHAGGDDFFLGGKYLITKIKHSFSMERYTQELQLRKDSLHNWAPGLEIEKVVTTKDVSAEAEVGQFGDEVAEEINSTPLVVMTPMAGADPTAKAMEGVGGPPWYDKAGELIGSEYGTEEFGGSGPPDYKPQAAYGPVYGSREDALKSHMPPGYDPATNTQN